MHWLPFPFLLWIGSLIVSIGLWVLDLLIVQHRDYLGKGWSPFGSGIKNTITLTNSKQETLCKCVQNHISGGAGLCDIALTPIA